MPNKENYDQIYGRNPVGNWFDNPPIGGVVPLAPAPLPEPRLPEPSLVDLGYMPPWAQPVPPSPSGQPEPMWRRPWEVGQ